MTPESDPADQGAGEAAQETAAGETASDGAKSGQADGPEGKAPIPSATADAAKGPGAPTYEELEAQVADLKDKLLRALADQENTRRRAERDKQDASKYAVTNFARELLAVADNLRRALDSVDAEARKAAPAMENMFVGVEMTERELMNAFERVGIKPVDPLGARFDPNLHEAMFEMPDPSKPAGTVAQVVEVGYTIQDRVLRAAKVGVTSGGPKKSAKKTEPQADADEARPQSDGRKVYEAGQGGKGAHLNEEL